MLGCRRLDEPLLIVQQRIGSSVSALAPNASSSHEIGVQDLSPLYASYHALQTWLFESPLKRLELAHVDYRYGQGTAVSGVSILEFVPGKLAVTMTTSCRDCLTIIASAYRSRFNLTVSLSCTLVCARYMLRVCRASS